MIVAQKIMRNKETSFWILISLMICLILVLGAYIASTYLANPFSDTTRVSSADGSVQPTLSLRDPLSACWIDVLGETACARGTPRT